MFEEGGGGGGAQGFEMTGGGGGAPEGFTIGLTVKVDDEANDVIELRIAADAVVVDDKVDTGEDDPGENSLSCFALILRRSVPPALDTFDNDFFKLALVTFILAKRPAKEEISSNHSLQQNMSTQVTHIQKQVTKTVTSRKKYQISGNLPITVT